LLLTDLQLITTNFVVYGSTDPTHCHELYVVKLKFNENSIIGVKGQGHMSLKSNCFWGTP